MQTPRKAKAPATDRGFRGGVMSTKYRTQISREPWPTRLGDQRERVKLVYKPESATTGTLMAFGKTDEDAHRIMSIRPYAVHYRERANAA